MLDDLSVLMRQVGRALQEWVVNGGREGFWDGTQFHAKADVLAHQMIVDGLSKFAVQYPIVSEEDASASEKLKHERYWLIDPIDGTASYAAGFSGYVTQAALMENGEPVLAVVYAPALDELFVAERGCGAFKNEMRLPQKTTEKMTLIDNYPEPRGIAAEMYEQLAFQAYVESGSIGLKICRVADGIADAFVKDVPVRDWDTAAPQLILAEAGGRLTDRHGKALVYTGYGIHEGLVATRDSILAGKITTCLSLRT